MTFDESTRALYGIIDGPVHRDGCGHAPDEYVCSFEWFERPDREIRYDLYVYDNRYGSNVCLRESDVDSDYRDPGGLLSMAMKAGQSALYRRVCDILDAAGLVRWHRSTENSR